MQPSHDRITRPLISDPSSLVSFLSSSSSSSSSSSRASVVVVAGAGISVSSGVPAFRGEGGLYSSLQLSRLGLPSAELLFDLEYFLLDPCPFFRFAPQLLPRAELQPSLTHRLVAELQRRGRLLRMYTQNVDQLERKAGITRLVECHGSMRKFRCTKCRYSCATAEIEQEIREGKVVNCPLCNHVLKPGITFFGEGLPKEFDKHWQQDREKVELVIVMGTSLKVGSMMKILQSLPPHVPLVLMDRESVALPRGAVAEKFDLELVGACDDISRYLLAQLGWSVTDGSNTSQQPVPIAPGRFLFGAPAATPAAAMTSSKAPRRAAETEAEAKEQSENASDSRKRAKCTTTLTSPPLPSQPQEHCRMCESALVRDGRDSCFFECAQCDRKYWLCTSCHSRGRNAHAAEYGHKFIRRQPQSDFILYT